MGKMSELAAEREAEAGPEQEPEAPKQKRQGISAEQAERLDRLWRAESFHGPAITSKTSMGHLRSAKFSVNKEPKK